MLENSGHQRLNNSWGYLQYRIGIVCFCISYLQSLLISHLQWLIASKDLWLFAKMKKRESLFLTFCCHVMLSIRKLCVVNVFYRTMVGHEMNILLKVINPASKAPFLATLTFQCITRRYWKQTSWSHQM